MTGSSAQNIGFGRTDRAAIVTEMLVAGAEDHWTPPDYSHVLDDVIHGIKIDCPECEENHDVDDSCLSRIGTGRLGPQPRTIGLICPSCGLTTCAGKIPGADCETSETDHGAWRGYLTHPLSRLSIAST